MSEHVAPYIERHPGDLVTAEDWNAVQREIRSDIRATADEAAGSISHVASADDAAQIDGMDPDRLTEEVTKRVLEAVRAEGGYRQLFKILRPGEYNVIEHGLGACPLVDVYKLRHFEVVCREDDATYPAFVTFYLHHSGEKRIRYTGNGAARWIDIQPDDPPTPGIPFADMLARYDVSYTDQTSLADLETEFWKAFFADPNDAFSDDQYCHSPWFERCCQEQRDVRSLKQRGDWDDIRLQFRAWKTVNFPYRREQDGDERPLEDRPPEPPNVAVGQIGLDSLALSLLGPAVHHRDEREEPRDDGGAVTGATPDELKVMVLLKV